MLSIAVIISVAPGVAQWSTTTNTQNALFVCPGFSPNILTFADGSSIITGTLEDYIYVQKLDENGYPLWPQYVLAHHNDSTNSLGGTGLIKDETGGVILTWGDHRGATPGPNGYYNNATYMQRVDGTGQVRWANGGVQVAPAYTGRKGGYGVPDGVGGIVHVFEERDWDYPGAANIERLWATRYNADGQRLWQLYLDSSTVQNTLYGAAWARLGSYIPILGAPNNWVIDTSGNIIQNFPLPAQGSFILDNDSIVFWGAGTAFVDTVADTIFVYTSITKYTLDFDTCWSVLLKRVKDGDYATGIAPALVGDGLGGVFYVQSTYNDINNIWTRVYHLDSLGNTVWGPNMVFLPGRPTIVASHDGSGGIVLVMGFYSHMAARFDYAGNPAWAGQPITVIADSQNLGPIRAAGDLNGGAIIPFWSIFGGINVQHTGRNGSVGVITGVGNEATLPSSVKLYQNYPNPFNPSTTIEFSVGTSGHIKIEVFDLLGRKVATLVDEMKLVGSYSVTWQPERSASGVYYYALQVNNNKQIVRKMLLVR